MLLPITNPETTELQPESASQGNEGTFSHMADDELAELAKRDERALAALYRRHVERIARYVSRRIRSQQDAEDITSQVFLSMVRGLPKWKSSHAPFVAWLYRLATNAVISWVRRQKFRQWIGLSSEPKSPPAPPVDDVDELNVAMQQLNEPFLSAIVLHYIEQLPVATVARVLGVTEGTVKSRLSRGRAMLRQIIESKSNQ